jgi:hypothetical protein
VYQCRCWFALASGYDCSSLGGEGKVTWAVVANKSGVEKVIFLGEFSHCGYKVFLKKLGFFLKYCEFVMIKNDQKVGKVDKIYKPQNWERKRKRNTGTEVYICVHSK